MTFSLGSLGFALWYRVPISPDLEVYFVTYYVYSPYIEVLSIHMDEQIDGKTLIGSYVCSEKPGEFRWQPGSLTQVCPLWKNFLLIMFLAVIIYCFNTSRLLSMEFGLFLRISIKLRLMCNPSCCLYWKVQVHS